VHLQFKSFCLLAAADALFAVFEGAAAFNRAMALAQITHGRAGNRRATCGATILSCRASSAAS